MKLALIIGIAGLALLAIFFPALAQDAAATPQSPAADSAGEAAATAALAADQAAADALAAGEIPIAETELRRAIELQPSPDRYLRLIALLTDNPGRTDALAIAWVELLATFPDDPRTHLANGDRLYGAGRYRAAAAAFDHGAAAALHDPRFPHRSGNCHYSLGEFTEAARRYHESLGLEFNPSVVANLCGAYVQSGEAGRAAATWDHYLALYPEDAALRLWYGITLANAGEISAALTQFERGLRLDPENDELFNRAGLCLFQLGRYPEAATAVSRAIDLRPDPLYYTNLTVTLEAMNDTARTGDAYREALELYPDHQGLKTAYARFLKTSGEGTAALEQLRALADEQGSGTALADVARQAVELGDNGLAETAFIEALSLAPGDALLHVDYALLLARTGRDAELLSHLRTASQDLPAEDYHWIIDEVASYWLDEFEYRHGAAVMEQLIAQDPTADVAYNGLAMFLQLLDDGPAALAAVKRGLHDAGDNYFGRYLEVYLTGLVYGAEDARGLAPELLQHPGADADAYLLYLDLFTGVADTDSLAAVANDGLSAHPQSAALLKSLATLLYNSGNTAGVIEVLSDRRYATLQWELRHELLGHCYLETGNYVKAAAELTRAVEQSNADPALWALLGQTQYYIGRLAEARTSLTYALALDPQEAMAHLWLGYTLLAGGDPAGAAVSFDSADAIEMAPMDLPAWLALGRAMAALDTGDVPLAQRHLLDAQVYMIEAPRFHEMLAEAKARAGL